MTCESYQQEISTLFDNRLGKQRYAEVFAHLAQCEACRTFYSSTNKTRVATAAWKPLPLSEQVDEKVFRQLWATDTQIPGHLRAMKESRPTQYQRPPWDRMIPVSLPSVIVLLLMFLVGGMLASTNQQEQSQVDRQQYDEMLYRQQHFLQ
ncbi:MAG: zf-HC2 domain-containing protein [bacterium]